MTNRNQFLDESNIADPDQILLSLFKTTATTVTQLYKESLNQSTKSYKNGYKQCLLDLMHFASLQQHQRGNTQGIRIALTFDELMTFYNTKQNQMNSLDENSNQGLSHSSSMSNDEPNTNTNDTVVNNNNNNNDQDVNAGNTIEINNADSNDIPTEKNINFNDSENENNEKSNLTHLKSNISKGFTFRFNNDQFSTNFNNLNIINTQESMKRRLGGNTINFFGKTFNFENFKNDNFKNDSFDIDIDNEPPFKRNRWRRDDRMAE